MAMSFEWEPLRARAVVLKGTKNVISTNVWQDTLGHWHWSAQSQLGKCEGSGGTSRGLTWCMAMAEEAAEMLHRAEEKTD